MNETLNLDNDLFLKVCLENDEKAYQSLFRHYYAPLSLYALRFIPSREIAEDLVQEVFYKLWRDRRSIRISTSIRAYLITSVKHHCLNYIRHREVEMNYVSEHLSIMTEAGREEDILTARELQQLIDKAIMGLPEKLRTVFLMHRRQDMTYAQISTQMSISIKTVESYMGKSLKMIRSRLHEYAPFS